MSDISTPPALQVWRLDQADAAEHNHSSGRCFAAVLEQKASLVEFASTISPDDFYLEKHALAYEAMLACLARRVPPDLATVGSELRRQERLDLVGGLTFLGELVNEVPTAVHVTYYAEIVARTATLRRLIEAGGTITGLGFEQRQELDQTLDQAEQTLFAVSQRQRGADFVPMSTVVQQYFECSQKTPSVVLGTAILRRGSPGASALGGSAGQDVPIEADEQACYYSVYEADRPTQVAADARTSRRPTAHA